MHFWQAMVTFTIAFFGTLAPVDDLSHCQLAIYTDRNHMPSQFVRWITIHPEIRTIEGKKTAVLVPNDKTVKVKAGQWLAYECTGAKFYFLIR